MSRRKLLTLGLTALWLLTSLFAMANSSTTADQKVDGDLGTSRLIDSIVLAKPIERPHPKYPESEARGGNEGWVKLSFVIGTDGETKEVNIVDSSGSRNFEKEALRSVKKWRYEPAVADGENIEQCSTSVQLDFHLGKPTITRKSKKNIIQALDLLNQNKYEELTNYVESYVSKPSGKMVEQAYNSYIAAKYYRWQGNEISEYHFLNIAASYAYRDGNFRYIPEEHTLSLLGALFELQLQRNELSKAKETYTKISTGKSEYAKRLVELYQPYKQKVDDFIASHNPIRVDAELNDSGAWFHMLARNSFTFTDLEGELRKLDIRCQNKRFTYTAKTDSQWTIPKKWGQCQVVVSGEQGAKFSLVELSVSTEESAS